MRVPDYRTADSVEAAVTEALKSFPGVVVSCWEYRQDFSEVRITLADIVHGVLGPPSRWLKIGEPVDYRQYLARAG